MPSVAANTKTLNFILTGQIRSGTGLVQKTLAGCQGVYCHENLLYRPNATDCDTLRLRQECHEAYFGPGKNSEKLPEFFHPLGNGYSAPRYLGDFIFDNPQRGEMSLGVRATYDVLNHLDLFDFIRQRHWDGDFCLVHVVRNPVACFVSLKQAEQSNVWQQQANDPVPERYPLSIFVALDELAQFVSTHLTAMARLREACRDVYLIDYRDLLYYFERTLRQLFAFLEVPLTHLPAPGSRRLKHRGLIPSRVYGWDALVRAAPSWLRELMLAEDLE